MKGVPSPSWLQSKLTRPETDDYQAQGLLAGAYTAPRPPPKPPSKFSFFRAPSFSSLNSAYSDPSQPYSPATPSLRSNTPSTPNLHPYSAMAPAPLPVVSSNHDASEDESVCPVCLEPLSFSFRLPGEKPHIVPECGHALHEVCFSSVYGPPPGQNVVRKSSLGVCGVCRRPMKVGDGDGGKGNKLAALTGMGNRANLAANLYPGRDAASIRSTSRSAPSTHSISKPYDPTSDDPLEFGAPSVRSGEHGGGGGGQYVVAPSIQVRAEFPTLTRSTGEENQPLTCIVVVELPGKRNAGHVPGHESGFLPPPPAARNHSRQETSASGHSSPFPDHRSQYSQHQPYAHGETVQSPNANANPAHDSVLTDAASLLSPTQEDENNPFASITEDLRNRIIDWKGHPLSGLGPLQMYDLLSVRRDSLVREFFVYLFKEAIICVVEEKKKSLGRFLSGAGGGGGGGVGGAGVVEAQAKGVLRLKGRIYIRHIKQVTDTSSAGEMSLTIDMEDERLDSFILIFRERSSLETWRSHIQSLVNAFQLPSRSAPEMRNPDLEEFGGSAKAARMLSGSSTTTTSVSTIDSLLNGSSRSTMSSSTSHGSLGRQQPPPPHHKLSTLEEADDEAGRYEAHSNLVTPHLSSGPSNSLTPLPHPPLDLLLVISVPPPTAVPSTAALKIRVIKNTLDFILASLAPRDRLCLVTFEVGVGGQVRKTPYLSIGRTQSRARLAKFVDDIRLRREDEVGYEDEFLVRGTKDEKTDVVTAVNHGLDVVLQRKARNPISGMILVSDTSESTRRAQMDLVLARAEAANMPIHSFGYGRSHDPASLWLMSNHTNGTYVFVKDWYDLRDCVAGCVGGMMSIGLLNMRLHMKILDGNRFKIRKVSCGPPYVLSSDGRDVDVEVGELRYGEKKEMLVELELDSSDSAGKKELPPSSTPASRHQQRALNATDEWTRSMGFDALALEDTTPNLVEGMMDHMIDEVPVFEVDGSFYDPQATKNVSRLAHPVLLTVTLLPPAGGRPKTPMKSSDPVIVRRRMELLTSDMITRVLVLVSKKNFPHSLKVMNETRRILNTVLQTVTESLPPPSTSGSTTRSRKEVLTLATVRAIQAMLQDIQILSDGLEESVELWMHDQRNFGAQQALILREQKSWSNRSATERLFWTSDNSIELVSRSNDWVARD